MKIRSVVKPEYDSHVLDAGGVPRILAESVVEAVAELVVKPEQGGLVALGFVALDEPAFKRLEFVAGEPTVAVAVRAVMVAAEARHERRVVGEASRLGDRFHASRVSDIRHPCEQAVVPGDVAAGIQVPVAVNL